MTLSMEQSFFNYFPVAPKHRAWGLYATSFGQVRVPPGASYPPGRHPENHHFAWENGRTLPGYQLLYIHDGRGLFESSLTKKKKLTGGTAFILFPGIWHRYRPDVATGWTESWIEMSGPFIEQLQASRIIDPRKPIYRIEAVTEVENLFQTALSLAYAKPSAFAIRLGLIAIEIITLMRSGIFREKAVPKRINQVISQAQALLGQNLGKPASPARMAQQMGVSYSYFRREFKRQTGFSPKQYQNEIRRNRAKTLLRNTSHTIKEIAEQLDYYSPYHFTLDFSKNMGVPPSRWRTARASPVM
jgi:AraC-like DNA-binding protein